MNDLVVLTCGVILLLAVLPMFLMSLAFKGAGKREGDRGDASLAVRVDNPPTKSKTGFGPDDSASDGGGDGGDGGGGAE